MFNSNVDLYTFRRKSVRLGEYNTDTELDCIDEGGDLDCADYPIDSAVERIIPHPEYSSSDWNKYNDIALLRLEKTINFTDFIRPICLPTESFTIEPGIFMSLCGWGKTDLCKIKKKTQTQPYELIAIR